MIVLCPQCQSRYQLSDEKIKTSGTKVRCPRCQHTFRVFPELRIDDERTELFKNRSFIVDAPASNSDNSSATEVDRTVRGQAIPDDEREDTRPAPAAAAPSPFDAATQVSPAVREPSPFKRPSAPVKAPAKDFVEEHDESSAPTQPPVRSPATAFLPTESDETTAYDGNMASIARSATPAAAPPREVPVHSPVEDRPAANPFQGQTQASEPWTSQPRSTPAPERDEFEIEEAAPSPQEPQAFDEDFANEDDQIPTAPRASGKKKREEIVEDQGPARALNAQTYFEIQDQAKPKRSGRKWLVIAASVIISTGALGVIFYSMAPNNSVSSLRSKLANGSTNNSKAAPQTPAPSAIPSAPSHSQTNNAPAPQNSRPTEQTQPHTNPSAPVESSPPPAQNSLENTPINLNRPATWYKLLPSVFQDYLSQTATLPPSEKTDPEIRALVAEALILNGVLTNTQDQVVTGMSYASSLVATHPREAFGYYGLLAFALWKADSTTVADLIQRWPAPNHSDFEYRMGHAIVLARMERNPAAAFQELKALHTEKPAYATLAAWTILLAGDFPKEALAAFGTLPPADSLATVEKHAALMKKRFQSQPNLYTEAFKKAAYLDKVSKSLAARNKKVEEPAKVEAPAKTEPAKKSATAPTPAAPAAKAPAERKAPGVSKRGLPLASEDLLSANKEKKDGRADAAKDLKEGIRKQEQGHPDEAIAKLQAALKADPDMAEAYKRLGMIFMSKRENDRAVRNFKIYLQLAPQTNDRDQVERWIASLQ